MSQDEAGPSSMSEDSLAFLEEVKKGKPRRFAMICKGASVVSLVVYKKGNVEKYRKEAKEAGKGQFYFGAVEGKGLDLRFVLARADGFDSAPVKTTVLKGFLDEAGIKAKPLFEIVDTAPLVLDESDPLTARFLALREQALRACETYPARAAELNALCQQIPPLLGAEDSLPAEARLGELERLLAGLDAPPSPQVQDAPPGPPPQDDSALAAKLAESLKKLKAAADTLVLAQPGRKPELFTAITGVAGLIKNKEWDAARAAMVELAKKIQNKSPDPSPSPTDEQAARFAERRRELEPSLLEAQRANREKATALGNVWTYALEQAAAGNFAQALKAFDRLEAAIRDVLSSTSSEPGGLSPGTVQGSAWTLELRTARLAAARGMGLLEEALRATEDPDALQIADTVAQLHAHFPDHLEKLLEGLAKAEKTQHVEALAKLKPAARKAVGDWTAFLDKHRREIEGCEKNPWKIPVAINEPLRGSLQNILQGPLA